MSTCVHVGVENVDPTRGFCFYEMQILMFREPLIFGKNEDFALHREKSLCRCEYVRILRFKCIIKWDACFNVISNMKHGATQH